MGFKIKKNIVINGYRNITFGFLGLPELLKKTFIDTTGSLLKSEKGTTKHLLVIDDNDQTQFHWSETSDIILSAVWVAFKSRMYLFNYLLSLFSAFLAEHRAVTIVLHLTLFWTFLFCFISDLSIVISSFILVLLQLSNGHPCLLWPCGFQSKASLVKLFWGFSPYLASP